jgi:hypothetical protein
MHTVSGGCRCGNILVSLKLARDLATYRPRVCDCDFCCQQGAAYVSDPLGSLSIGISRPSETQRLRQGTLAAEFLMCRHCNVLVAVLFESEGQCLAAINARIVEQPEVFGAELPVSPKNLSRHEKTDRWKAAWFSSVVISTGQP